MSNITLRGTKGSPLTYEEIDGNFNYLDHKFWISTSNPTAKDDSSKGYTVGSQWANMATKKLFSCANATAGAAVWIESTPVVLGSKRYSVAVSDESIKFDSNNKNALLWADIDVPGDGATASVLNSAVLGSFQTEDAQQSTEVVADTSVVVSDSTSSEGIEAENSLVSATGNWGHGSFTRSVSAGYIYPWNINNDPYPIGLGASALAGNLVVVSGAHEKEQSNLVGAVVAGSAVSVGKFCGLSCGDGWAELNNKYEMQIVSDEQTDKVGGIKASKLLVSAVTSDDNNNDHANIARIYIQPDSVYRAKGTIVGKDKSSAKHVVADVDLVFTCTAIGQGGVTVESFNVNKVSATFDKWSVTTGSTSKDGALLPYVEIVFSGDAGKEEVWSMALDGVSVSTDTSDRSKESAS